MTIAEVSLQQQQNPMWGDDWATVRSNWTLTESVLHFNHGAYGSVPKAVRQHQMSIIERVDQNATGFFRRELELLLEDARLKAAKFCGADPHGFAWVKNVSEGMTVALAAMPLKVGDEVLITNHIYPAVKFAVENRCRAVGAEIVEVQIPSSENDEELVSIIAAGITNRTRLLVVDEVASISARIFPIREIAKITKAKNITLIIDGAHALGTYEVELDTLGADIWLGNFHKWMCSPHGAGALWAAPQWRSKLNPSSVSYSDRKPYPQRFSRLGTDDQTAVLSVPAAIDFLSQLGLERVYAHNSALANFGADAVAAAIGSTQMPGKYGARRRVALPGGIVNDDDAAYKLQREIAEQLKTELSVSPPMTNEEPGTLGISAYVYNHPEEYERFGQALQKFLAKRK